MQKQLTEFMSPILAALLLASALVAQLSKLAKHAPPGKVTQQVQGGSVAGTPSQITRAPCLSCVPCSAFCCQNSCSFSTTFTEISRFIQKQVYYLDYNIFSRRMVLNTRQEGNFIMCDHFYIKRHTKELYGQYEVPPISDPFHIGKRQITHP